MCPRYEILLCYETLMAGTNKGYENAWMTIFVYLVNNICISITIVNCFKSRNRKTNYKTYTIISHLQVRSLYIKMGKDIT